MYLRKIKKFILGCIRKIIANRLWMILHLHSVLLRSHLERCVQLWASCTEDIYGHNRASSQKIIKELLFLWSWEHYNHSAWIREHPGQISVCISIRWKGANRLQPSLQGYSVKSWGTEHKMKNRKWFKQKYLYSKGDDTLEQSAQNLGNLHPWRHSKLDSTAVGNLL